MKRLLLVSSSKTHGQGYLDHCASEIVDLLGSLEKVLFVPFALFDWDGYAGRARRRFSSMGYKLNSVHQTEDPRQAAREAEAIFIGGGNTFRLLDHLYRFGLLEILRSRVESGAPYIGTSAGSNVACPTIQTTNDMPIVEPPSFAALNLVPFNINPHYLDPIPGSTHQGETREQRIGEFLEENDRTVVGLREGAMLRIDGPQAVLRGSAGARIFRRDRTAEEFEPGARLDLLFE